MTISDDDLADLLDAERYDRRVKVMFLRNAGATYQKISQELGISIATVRKDYDKACRDYSSQTFEQRMAVQQAVILDIRRANYPAMMRGDTDAASVILRGLKQEALLYGLYAPARLIASVSDIEFANEAARLIESINRIDPAALKELKRATESDAERIIDAELDEFTAEQQRDERSDAVPAAGPDRDGELAGGAGGGSGDIDGAADSGSDVDAGGGDPDADEWTDDWSNL